MLTYFDVKLLWQVLAIDGAYLHSSHFLFLNSSVWYFLLSWDWMFWGIKMEYRRHSFQKAAFWDFFSNIFEYCFKVFFISLMYAEKVLL